MQDYNQRNIEEIKGFVKGEPLTIKELELLRILCKKVTIQIAMGVLEVSEATAKRYLSNYRKLKNMERRQRVTIAQFLSFYTDVNFFEIVPESAKSIGNRAA
ncbi:MAG: hypothetical protein AAF599_00150 [Bacteroidota bacterium]